VGGRQLDLASWWESLGLGVTLVYPRAGTSFSIRSQSSGSPLPQSHNPRHGRQAHIQYLRQQSNDRLWSSSNGI